jgi:hypothetical protein
MNQPTFRLLAALLAILLSSPAMAESSPSASATGIEGTISMSPARGGPQREGESSTAPLPDIRFVVQQNDKPVTTFTTDSQGAFRVVLEPGHYNVVRDGNVRIGHMAFEAEVEAGKMTKVKWVGDSGLR